MQHARRWRNSWRGKVKRESTCQLLLVHGWLWYQRSMEPGLVMVRLDRSSFVYQSLDDHINLLYNHSFQWESLAGDYNCGECGWQWRRRPNDQWLSLLKVADEDMPGPRERHNQLVHNQLSRLKMSLVGAIESQHFSAPTDTHQFPTYSPLHNHEITDLPTTMLS